MIPVHSTCFIGLFSILVALGIQGCTDQDARNNAQKALEEVQRLKEQLNTITESAITARMSERKAGETAAVALDSAKAAQACCDATTERLDRMYQKIMSR